MDQGEKYLLNIGALAPSFLCGVALVLLVQLAATRNQYKFNP